MESRFLTHQNYWTKENNKKPKYGIITDEKNVLSQKSYLMTYIMGVVYIITSIQYLKILSKNNHSSLCVEGGGGSFYPDND
jgi:hypothetical protein